MIPLFRFLAAFLVSVALTVSSVCWTGAHACCPPPEAAITQVPGAQNHDCCVSAAPTDRKLSHPQFGLDWTPLIPPPVFRGNDFYRALGEPQQQSLRQKAWLQDQSGRHLELSVLLN